jgi:hypothetical protein
VAVDDSLLAFATLFDSDAASLTRRSIRAGHGPPNCSAHLSNQGRGGALMRVLRGVALQYAYPRLYAAVRANRRGTSTSQSTSDDETVEHRAPHAARGRTVESRSCGNCGL